MSLEFPWAAFMEAQKQKNQNRQDFNQNIAGLGQGLGQGLDTLAQAREAQKKKEQWSKTINEMMVNPNLPQQIKSMLPMISQNPSLAGQILPSAIKTQSKPASYLSGLTFDNATPEQQNLAKALVEGNVRPSDLSFKDRGQIVLLANEYAQKRGIPFQSFRGDINAGAGKAFAYGKPGLNALSLNTALGHAGSAYQAFQEIGNTDQAWLNKPINILKKETNDPNVVKLGISLNALRGELATTFKGSGGTDQEISSWMNYLNENLTPVQASAAIQQIDELLRSRLSALQYQQHDVMDNPPSRRTLLSPHAKELSTQLSKVGNKKSVNSKLGSGPKVGTIENGFRFKGGNPSDPKSWEKQ